MAPLKSKIAGVKTNKAKAPTANIPANGPAYTTSDPNATNPAVADKIPIAISPALFKIEATASVVSLALVGSISELPKTESANDIMLDAKAIIGRVRSKSAAAPKSISGA